MPLHFADAFVDAPGLLHCIDAGAHELLDLQVCGGLLRHVLAQEVMDQTGGRMGQHLFRGGHLLNFAVVHENNEISKVKGFLHVVGDKDDGFVQLLLQGFHLLLEGAPGHGVQRAEGLIHENNGRGSGQGTQDSHTLLLSAGHF